MLLEFKFIIYNILVDKLKLTYTCTRKTMIEMTDGEFSAGKRKLKHFDSVFKDTIPFYVSNLFGVAFICKLKQGLLLCYLSITFHCLGMPQKVRYRFFSTPL